MGDPLRASVRPALAHSIQQVRLLLLPGSQSGGGGLPYITCVNTYLSPQSSTGLKMCFSATTSVVPLHPDPAQKVLVLILHRRKWEPEGQ